MSSLFSSQKDRYVLSSSREVALFYCLWEFGIPDGYRKFKRLARYGYAGTKYELPCVGRQLQTQTDVRDFQSHVASVYGLMLGRLGKRLGPVVYYLRSV